MAVGGLRDAARQRQREREREIYIYMDIHTPNQLQICKVIGNWRYAVKPEHTSHTGQST